MLKKNDFDYIYIFFDNDIFYVLKLSQYLFIIKSITLKLFIRF